MWFGNRHSRRDIDLDSEIRDHLARAAAHHAAKGLSPAEADRAARREFGSVTLVSEMTREAASPVWVRHLVQDLRFGVRMLARTPLLTAVVAVTLAIGIGATTAVFSIVQAVLLQPLSYQRPETLVALWDSRPRDANLAKVFASLDDFDHWKSEAQSFETLAAATWATGDHVLTGRGPARIVLAVPASLEFFDLLGVAPQVGRGFQPQDLASGCTAVLSYRFWETALEAAPAIVGDSLAIDDRSCTVVGIMPAQFHFYPEATDLWTLITADRQQLAAGVGVFGRLKPGVTLAAAQDEVRRLHSTAQTPDTHAADFVPAVYPLRDEFTWLAGRNLEVTLLALFAAVVFVLLIACVNIANVLLGRSVRRQREFAIRAALGANRSRLLRQLLSESLLLSGLGASVGMLFAIWAVRLFRVANPITLPAGRMVEVNLYVLFFTAGLTVITALLAGIPPALGASKADANSTLVAATRASAGRGRRRAGKVLVVIEMACAVVLLVGAGLLIESVAQLGGTPLGFDANRLLTMAIRLPRTEYPTPAARASFYDRLLERGGAVPGVEGVSLSTNVLRGRGTNSVTIEGRPPVAPSTQSTDVGLDSVGVDFFAVMRVPVLAGRVFGPADRLGAEPVAIVNDALAAKYFPGESPLDKRIKFGTAATSPMLRIVGVVGNQKATNVYQEMDWAETPFLFRPLAQTALSQVFVVVRTASDPTLVAGTMQRVISSLDANVPTSDVATMQQRLATLLAYPAFRANMLAGFSGLALLLVVVGLYGVLSQLVAERTQEIGIRMSLGASSGSVLRLIVWEGLSLALIGGGAGLLAAWWLTRFMGWMLYATQPLDPLTYGAVMTLLMIVAALAALVPASRAASVDPNVALRQG